MLKIRLTIIIFLISLVFSEESQAQFYTIQKMSPPEYILLKGEKSETEQTVIQDITDTIKSEVATVGSELFRVARNRPKRNASPARKKHLASVEGLPPLTIENLVKEIKRNNLQHPKIVLAQAILETGWFQSNVCRTKNNLFGLTNPRTGQYYEFDHWTESVSAYYTKVQYRYKGGNYLLWLKKIGYAEAPDYIQCLARILTQYMID